MKYDFINFKKNKKKITDKIKEIDDTIIVTGKLFVLFPDRFIVSGIATITDKVSVLGIVCVMDEDMNYYNIILPHYLSMEPSRVEDITLDNKAYKMLVFEKGTKLLSSRKVLKDSEFSTVILNDFIIKGNMPIYVEYNEMLGLNEYDITMSVLLSIVARVPGETTYIRNSEYKGAIHWVGLNNIHYLNNTYSKITGNYLSKGLVSAIVNPEEEGIVHNDLLTV